MGLVRGQREWMFMTERGDSRELSDALAALLELEDDVARRLEGARRASERSLEQARESAQRARDHRPQELREALREQKLRLESDQRAKLAAIDDGARREAERFDSLEGETVSSLADALADELLELVVSRAGTS